MERIDLVAQYAPIEMAIHSCRYLPARDMVAGKKVLDIACGEGIGIGLLLEWGAAEVVGVDLSQAAISAAQAAFLDHPNARFVCSDALAFLEQYGADFDIIISVETIEHLPDPEAFLKKLAEKRRADATVIISCPNDYFYYGRGSSLNPYHMTQFTFTDFSKMAEQHLGRASWYLGTPNNGFSAVAMATVNKSSKDFTQSFSKFSPATGSMVPAPIRPQERLKPSTSLFYLGIWSRKPLSSAYQTSFAATSHYRLPSIVSVSEDVAIGRTHKVAFVIDQHGWAFDNIVRNMEPYLKGRYSVSFYYIADYENSAELLRDIFVDNVYDNVHFMWREFLFFTLSHPRIMLNLLKLSKLTPAELAAKIAAPALTTSVYDHLFLRDEDVEERQDHFALVDGYATSSVHLQKAYNKAYEKKPVIEISDGVNFELFAPARAAQAAREVGGDQVVRIGWVGNSSWGQGNPSMSDDPKGLHSIIVPAIERLALEGYPVALALADRNIRKRDRAEMVTYYGEIDILVCASAAEGTPNPVLEAMASGVPFVSTDVGIVREAAGTRQSAFILRQRTVLGIYQLLKTMLDNPEERAAIAAENLERIQDWGWKNKTTRWLRLFASAEHNHKASGQNLRRMTLSARLETWVKDATLVELRKELSMAQKTNLRQQEKLKERTAVTEAQNKATIAKLIASNKDQNAKDRERLDKLKSILEGKDKTLAYTLQRTEALQNSLLKAQKENEIAKAEMKNLLARIPITRKRVLLGIKRKVGRALGLK